MTAPWFTAIAVALTIFGAGGLCHLHRVERVGRARRTHTNVQRAPLGRREEGS